MLSERNVSPFLIRFLLFLYTDQVMRVKWKDCLSANFSIINGVRQGAVLPPLLFTLYIDMLFITLQDLGLGCHIGPIFAGSFGYADDVALVALTLYSMDKMIKVCEIFAVCRFIGKTNAIVCDFGCCDSSTLVNIHITFCMELYGCELWNISSKYTEEMHTAWRITL